MSLEIKSWRLKLRWLVEAYKQIAIILVDIFNGIWMGSVPKMKRAESWGFDKDSTDTHPAYEQHNHPHMHKHKEHLQSSSFDSHLLCGVTQISHFFPCAVIMTITDRIYGNPATFTPSLNELRNRDGILNSKPYGVCIQVAAVNMEGGTALQIDFSV